MSDFIVNDKNHQKDYYGVLYTQLMIEDFIDKEAEDDFIIKKTAAPFDVPDIQPLPEEGADPNDQGMGGLPPAPNAIPPGLDPAAGGPPPDMGGMPPMPDMGGGMPPMPDMGAPAGGPGGPPPPATPPPAAPPSVKDNSKELEGLLKSVTKLNDDLSEMKNDLRFNQLEKYVKDHVNKLNDELMDLVDRKVPKRETYDTEGVYREQLYNIVTEVLDGVLPDLLEEIPDYNFLASQVSRTYEDGTIADAIVSLNIVVPRDGNRYDFKMDIPILNGIIQIPQYFTRGLKIVPLTKPEVQRELNSMTYRKMDIDTPYEKENIFSNLGENYGKQPDTQKPIFTQMSNRIPTNLPEDHNYHQQQKNPYRRN